MQWLLDLLMFFFPVNCIVCGKPLSPPSGVICLECEYQMPRTGYGDRSDNPVNKNFWGRVPIEMATSLFRFEKGSAYQAILHDLKYKGNRRAGLYLGQLLGHALTHTTFSDCDLLIPVPLHRRKLRQRGYNQSEIIARGISGILNIPVENNMLIRSIQNDSQILMGRIERFENVSGNFDLSSRHPDISGKKVLLIDDVLTTGATLEACSRILLDHFDCIVYVATVCCA
jgi:ComF family protein